MLSSLKTIQIMGKFGHQLFKNTSMCLVLAFSLAPELSSWNSVVPLELKFSHYLSMYFFYRITLNTFFEVCSLRMSETLTPEVAVSTWHEWGVPNRNKLTIYSIEFVCKWSLSVALSLLIPDPIRKQKRVQVSLGTVAHCGEQPFWLSSIKQLCDS